MRPGEPLYQRPTPGADGEGRRLFLTIALSAGLVWLMFTFLLPKPQTAAPADGGDDRGAATGAHAVADGGSGDDSSGVVEPVGVSAGDDDSAGGGDGEPVGAQGEDAPPRPEPEEEIAAFERDLFSAEFSNQGGGPSSWLLHEYRQPLDVPWLPTWLWDGVKSGFHFAPFSLRCPEADPEEIVPSRHAYHLVSTFQEGDPFVGGTRWEVLERGEDHITFRTHRGGMEITTAYDIPRDGYLMDVVVTVTNESSEERTIHPAFSVVRTIETPKSRYQRPYAPFRSVAGKSKEYVPKKLDKKGLIRETEGPVAFGGIGGRYFMTAIVPDEPAVAFEAAPLGYVSSDGLGLQSAPPLTEDGADAVSCYRSTLLMAERGLTPGETASYGMSVYMGPKVLSDLKQLGLGLDATVTYGVFSIIARPMLAALKLFHSFVGSWGLAIILLTFVVKLLVFPLDQASYKSMHKMRAVAPAMQEIRDKYKSDPQRQQQEIMNMYREKGVNPFSGCLPMMIQMPIWFALYRVLWGSIELYQVPFLYFCDLTSRDPLGVFPLVLAATMVVQQRMSPPPTDPNQKVMMQVMPIMFAVIMFALPSGLVLYILVSTILRLLQQWLVNRKGDREAEASEAVPEKTKNK